MYCCETVRSTPVFFLNTDVNENENTNVSFFATTFDYILETLYVYSFLTVWCANVKEPHISDLRTKMGNVCSKKVMIRFSSVNGVAL